MTMNTIELTDDELNTITSALNYARDNAVTDFESARIKMANTEVIRQWNDEGRTDD